MTKRLLIDGNHSTEKRVAILDEDFLEHFDFVSSAKRQIKGNIFLGKITRIEPSLQAAFVEYGGGKQGFLPFSEIHPDYYQIPIADRQRLMEEAARLAEEEERRAEAELEREEAALADIREFAAAPISPDTFDDAKPSVESESPAPIKDHPNASGDFVSPEAVEQGVDSETAIAAGDVEAIESFAGPDDGIVDADSASDAEEARGNEPDDQETGEGDSGEETGSGRRRGRRRYGRSRQSRSSAPRDLETAEDDHEPHESHDDDDHEVSKPRHVFTRRYKIQEVIKPSQIVLVQAVKEERGNKGCSLSTYISLPGRYCVLMPNSPKDGGISRKIGSNADRKRLKDIAANLKEAGRMSAIIRTAGIDRTQAEIQRDYDYLIKLWGQVRDLALSSMAPALVYEEGDLVKRTIRDYYNGTIDEVVVQGEADFEAARDFMNMIMPSHTGRVKLFKDAQPLFHAFGVEEQLAELYQPIAPLPSGGYLVINPTEALISIDVNSGRSTGERNVEETAYKTNLEAAEEAARQLRLRDLGGLVVIDFIDMYQGRNRRAVEKALKDAMKDDRAKVAIGHISAFGLLELSRQRLGASLFEATTHACPHCKGLGHVRTPESTAMAIIRELESEAFESGAGEYRIRLTARDALSLMNGYRDRIGAIEAAHGLTVVFEIDPNLVDGVFTLDNGRGGGSHYRRAQDGRPSRRRSRSKTRRPEARERPSARPATPVEPNDTADEAGDAINGERVAPNGDEAERDGKRRRSRRGRRGGQRNRIPRDGEAANGEAKADTGTSTDVVELDSPVEISEGGEAGGAEGAAKPARRRSRGGRGRGKREAGETPQSAESANEPDASSATFDSPAPAPEQTVSSAAPRARRSRAKAVPEAASESAPEPAPATEPASTESRRKGWWTKITG